MINRRAAISGGLLSVLGLAVERLVGAQEAPRQRRRNPGPRPGPGAGGPLARFNQIFEEVMEEHGIAGGTIAVAKDGRLLLARGHGLADVEAGQRVTNKTLFSLASVTKSVSAVAALRLADQGRLNLERRLVDVLADLGPPAGQGIADPRFRDITVHQLLYHGSGLAHSTVRPEGNRGDNDEDEGDDDLVAVYRNALTIPLEFTPGTEHRYSNVGFLILRLVIERAAGQAYEPFVCQRILQPMGITDMVMERPEPIAGETKRYIVGPEGRRPARHIGHNWLATPTDMIKFLTALTGTRGQRFLSRRMTALMLAVPPPPIQPARDGRHVGLGWDTVRAVDGDHRFSKNGGKPGVSAWIEHLPGNVDWAFMLNTSVRASDKPGGPSAPSELIRRVDEVIEATTQWPQRDLF